ncbi:MarR family winged helix-turn-helix transcriptional regulator [Sinosporangium siamense]|uniref:MarR family winged helix-turn-helix transcriptional regulator n=1 Tax=Sinosporangium siamense TaxID=1367973 RepID=UPI001EF39195|nr:MarR family transcriptional regulator [Sinosporangium siamense]
MDDERSAMIKRIGDIQRELGRHFAEDQSSPLFSSPLTLRQLNVMMLLTSAGSASGQQIAQRLGVSLATVTGIVDRLVAHGLATRREDPADRRIRLVELTEEGGRLLQDIADAGFARYSRLLEQLDTDTLRELEAVMEKISRAAQGFA